LHKEIQYLGFPFSISENFQMRNTHKTIAESLITLQEILEIAYKTNKEVVTYISMGFGNPYGDAYNEEIVIKRTKQIQGLGVKIISIADTVGLATAKEVNVLMKTLMPEFTSIELGVHLHSLPAQRQEKIEAALDAGCTRFDAAIKGIGGCPMAGNDLVGNMDTEIMIQYFESKGYELNIDKLALQKCSLLAGEIFV
jgi:hydroxymethylglutaryl-CoA lyase